MKNILKLPFILMLILCWSYALPTWATDSCINLFSIEIEDRQTQKIVATIDQTKFALKSLAILDEGLGNVPVVAVASSPDTFLAALTKKVNLLYAFEDEHEKDASYWCCCFFSSIEGQNELLSQLQPIIVDFNIWILKANQALKSPLKFATHPKTLDYRNRIQSLRKIAGKLRSLNTLGHRWMGTEEYEQNLALNVIVKTMGFCLNKMTNLQSHFF